MTIENARRADDARKDCEARGIHGAAAELLVRLGAGARHTARVLATREAAVSYARSTSWTAQPLDQTPTSEDIARAGAGLVLLADIGGVGGEKGIAGAATRRHPALAGLGAGRWHAQDGGAYRAAAERALRGLVREIYVREGSVYVLLAAEAVVDASPWPGGLAKFEFESAEVLALLGPEHARAWSGRTLAEHVGLWPAPERPAVSVVVEDPAVLAGIYNSAAAALDGIVRAHLADVEAG